MLLYGILLVKHADFRYVQDLSSGFVTRILEAGCCVHLRLGTSVPTYAYKEREVDSGT